MTTQCHRGGFVLLLLLATIAGAGLAAQAPGAIGFHPVDLGALSMARYLEPMALAFAELAYNGAGCRALSYRFERLPR